MKTQTIVILVITLAILFTVFTSKPAMTEKDIKKSISLNIIGTANVVIACYKLNIKMIYFSTNFVYPGIKGNHKETDGLKPINNCGWSKLGGECAVHMYKNSLILRVCITEKTFIHKMAKTEF